MTFLMIIYDIDHDIKNNPREITHFFFVNKDVDLLYPVRTARPVPRTPQITRTLQMAPSRAIA